MPEHIGTIQGTTINEPKTSDRLHNENCCSYLKLVSLNSSAVLALLSPDLLSELTHTQENTFNPSTSYGNLYTRFFDEVEEKIDRMLQEAPDSKNELNRFLISLYENNNKILEHTYETIKHITGAQRPISRNLEASIEHHVRDQGTRINATSPAVEGSALGRFNATWWATKFNPMHTTSLATERHYRWSKEETVKECRFGTQAQRDGKTVRVSPLFKAYLSAKQDPADPEKITHVYINNLARNRTDAEGVKERALSLSLEELDKPGSPCNIAVITLPADKGFLSTNDYKKIKPKHEYSAVKQAFLAIASQDETDDFHMSPKVRSLLFKDQQENLLNGLIDKSFNAMGIKPGSKLSDAERQAVWFHFIKYELANHIIETLKPTTLNFSCKDAIDRGGVSSAYYNLMKSFNTPQPMSREEFDCALHAAPTMVKARGMNHHVIRIWNAVNQYVNNNQAALINNPDKAWLIEWRDLNCPHARIEGLLKQRVSECIAELTNAQTKAMDALTHVRPEDWSEEINEANTKKVAGIKQALILLTHIQEQSHLGASGKRLLLEATLCTTKMALHPEKIDTKQQEDYNALADNIRIHYPIFQMIAGLMKSFAAIILFVPSLGQTKETIKSGWATTKAGFEATHRQGIQADMKLHLDHLKQDDPQRPKQKDTRLKGD